VEYKEKKLSKPVKTGNASYDRH